MLKRKKGAVLRCTPAWKKAENTEELVNSVVTTGQNTLWTVLTCTMTQVTWIPKYNGFDDYKV